MKIYKTLTFFTDVADGIIWKCDTIEYKGHFWLVPNWLEAPALGKMRPVRIVLLDLFQKQDLRNETDPQADFVMNQGIPKAVFEGQIQTLGGIQVVIEGPPIEIPIPPLAH